MTQLDSRRRTELKDSDFAYVDSRGRRRLPIHDESHVRNALARFNQVIFEDESARTKARTRLLKAAKKYGIVPVGFIEGQLRAAGPRSLPSGTVTFLFTDIVDSTGLLQRLGDGYARVLNDVRRHIRTAVRRAGGREVDARGDEFFAVFTDAQSAVVAALGLQRALAAHEWPRGARVTVRAGVHTGRPTLTDAGYVGLAVHSVNRICNEAEGGQILISGATMAALEPDAATQAAFQSLGSRHLRGVREPVTLYEVRTV
ncbi:MAG TPA: adenylate/guanylate cyclase domain-containing protein [Candidatus Limnocylindria bacterium]|nr:adenylate/guanylate cyclase domain-containing protein [Candidatus Limnocylindria bacterium]